MQVEQPESSKQFLEQMRRKYLDSDKEMVTKVADSPNLAVPVVAE